MAVTDRSVRSGQTHAPSNDAECVYTYMCVCGICEC